MNDIYKVVQLTNAPYDYLVIAISYRNPLSYVNEMFGECESDQINAVFDLTLINGINSNRYVKCKLNKKSVFDSTFVATDSIEPSVSEISKRFFIENKDLVEKSVLSRPLKQIIGEGPL